jgi:MYXO-CTERM domain-containing protein
VILALLLAAGAAVASDVGTFASSTWYETIEDPDRGTVWFQIHYPAVSDDFGADADPSAGPFPLVAFMHGYLGQAWMYQSLCDAVASMGFVVVNLDTQTGAWMDPYALADDAQAALEWAEARSAERDHWLYGMVSDAPWTAMGHSMGGIALASLVDQEPRVQVAVGFAPYRDADYVWDAYTAYGGAALLIGGSEDETSTPDIVSGWLDDVDAPSRGLYASVRGAGHQAVTDIELEPEELSDAEQLSVSIDLAAAFLRAERFGEEQAYDTLVCSPPFPYDALRARGTAPATAALALDEASLRLSIVGAAGDTAVVYGGTGPGRGSTPDGVVGLAEPVELARVALPEGVACAELALPEELAGRAWLQTVHVRGDERVYGSILDVFDTGGTSPTGGDSGDTGQDDSAAPSDPSDDASAAGADEGCGCATGRGGPLPVEAWLGAALVMVTGLSWRRA